jgi:Tfp pilus assembly protein PilP
MKFLIVLIPVLIFVLVTSYGCKSKTQLPPPKTQKVQIEKQPESTFKAPQLESATQETLIQEGYIYKQRDRRDPFLPLIVPTKMGQNKDDIKVGTIEGYDISEFILAAIAKKRSKHFALLSTPDNRSFTVNEGTVIGLNKGKVEEISGDKVVLVEYSRDYRGELKSRQIILEFFKGE